MDIQIVNVSKGKPGRYSEGNLPIGEAILNVAVLNNKQRIISQNAVFKAFGRPVRGSRSRGDQDSGKLPGLIDAKNLKPFISNELMGVIKPVKYIEKSGKENEGYDASILALICEVYLDALRQHAYDNATLTPKQLPNAYAAEALSRVLMKVSIIALIDEVTGYQEAAEDFIYKTPCDPDITEEQIDANNKWLELINQPIK